MPDKIVDQDDGHQRASCANTHGSGNILAKKANLTQNALWPWVALPDFRNSQEDRTGMTPRGPATRQHQQAMSSTTTVLTWRPRSCLI